MNALFAERAKRNFEIAHGSRTSASGPRVVTHLTAMAAHGNAREEAFALDMLLSALYPSRVPANNSKRKRSR